MELEYKIIVAMAKETGALRKKQRFGMGRIL